MNYSDFEHLLFEQREHKVMLMTINRPEKMNAANARMHWELTKVWRLLDEDNNVNVIVVTGAGDKAFCAGGDIEWVDDMIGDSVEVSRVQSEAADLVYEMLKCKKPIISAINGTAVGAGVVVAMMSDISIMAAEARLSDGHVKLGVGAGDHAAIIWPILCGMAKAKYYLMTADMIDGQEAERIGLVSRCVPHQNLMAETWKIAKKLATGSQPAIRGTKQALNGWMQMASPIFENSLRMEMQGFHGQDVIEGVNAFKEKRKPNFPSCR